MTIILDIPICQLPHGQDLPVPAYQTKGAAGMDIMAANAQDIIIEPGCFAAVPTGICIAMPEGYEAQIRPRSGLAFRDGVTVLNSPGTIDSDYRGEIKIALINHGPERVTITYGMRIAQMVISQVTQAQFVITDSLDETDRGTGGFGSTGLEAKAQTPR
ncbi:MAG: dUTP diphosphatase [Candidatus Puniceispirillaceae bacterium]